MRNLKPLGLLGKGIDFHRSAINPLLAKDVVEFYRTRWPGSAATVQAPGWELSLRGDFAAAAKLTPTYIRPPEAQEAWERRHAAAMATANADVAGFATTPRAKPPQ